MSNPNIVFLCASLCFFVLLSPLSDLAVLITNAQVTSCIGSFSLDPNRVCDVLLTYLEVTLSSLTKQSVAVMPSLPLY